MTITITSDLDSQENAMLRQKLDEYNEPIVGKRETKELGYAIRDDNGELIAGLIGSIVWTMLHINVIWVSDVLRGNDVGSKLMRQAEKEASKQGCEFARLHTFSFQARPFYERLGYIVVNETKDFPKGHSQYLMVKAL